jgi:dihydroflavonol-4-reductase
MKALVTGANGFLGAWLTRRLLEEGCQVSALVRKNSDLSELSHCKPVYVYGDVTDRASLLTAFRDQDVIFHTAGVIAYRESERPLMDRVNVQGTQNVVDVCVELAIPRLLHISSVVAVGASITPAPLNEKSAYNISHLNMGYFETKRLAEKIVLTAAWNKKLHAVCVNPSTIYGFGDAKKGSRKTQVKVANGKFPFYTSGGVNVVAVEDVVDGAIKALEKGKSGERYILSSENLTIKDLFQTIADCAGVKAPQFLMPNWLLHAIGITGDQCYKLGLDIGVSRTNAYTASMFHWF